MTPDEKIYAWDLIEGLRAATTMLCAKLELAIIDERAEKLTEIELRTIQNQIEIMGALSQNRDPEEAHSAL